MLLPLLTPAIVAGAAITFAISIDDFVIAYWLSAARAPTRCPSYIYSATRAAPLPSTNAIAAILSLITLSSVVLGYLGYRFFTRGERQAGQGMVGDMAAFDI